MRFVESILTVALSLNAVSATALCPNPCAKYFTNNGKVFYGTQEGRSSAQEIVEADPATITNIAEPQIIWMPCCHDVHYGKDKRFVYFQKRRVDGADPESAHMVYGFLMDKTHLFIDGVIRKEFNASKFRFESGYFQDDDLILINKLSVPKKGTKLYPNTYYYADRDHVYYSGSIVASADPESFHVISPVQSVMFGNGDYGSAFSADKNRLYYNDEVLSSVQPASFRILLESGKWPTMYAVDSSHAYYGSNILQEADPKSFHLDPNKARACDKNAVCYQRGVLIR